MRKDDKYDIWTLVGGLLFVIAVMWAGRSDAGELTGGTTVRGDGFTGGAHIEYTWYTESRVWRWGFTYTRQQTLSESTTECSSLGAAGEVCFRRDLEIDPYPSVYVQRSLPLPGRRLYAYLGLAVHPVREPLLSLPASFRTSIGWRFTDTIALEWAHNSNAHLKTPNWGQDVLLLRYSF